MYSRQAYEQANLIERVISSLFTCIQEVLTENDKKTAPQLDTS